MAEQTKEVPTDPALAPAGAGEGETQSKKGAKKAEAKAKKEAEKARKVNPLCDFSFCTEANTSDRLPNARQLKPHPQPPPLKT